MPYDFTLTTIMSASAVEVYEAWLDSLAHSEMTGGEASMSDEIDADVSAWDGYISGRNLHLIPHERIVQSWRTTKFTDAHEDSVVTLSFEETQEGTLLTLVHSNVPDGQTSYEQGGWETHYFAPMRAYFAKSRHAPASRRAKPTAKPAARSKPTARHKPVALAKGNSPRPKPASATSTPRARLPSGKAAAKAATAKPQATKAKPSPAKPSPAKSARMKPAPAKPAPAKRKTATAKPKAKATAVRARAPSPKAKSAPISGAKAKTKPAARRAKPKGGAKP
jgi:uncharacterized protein YndB with AHSA1/START domain